MSRRLLILGWHNVEGTYCFPSPPGAGTAGLTRQLETLGRLAHVVDLSGALDTLARGGALPSRSVVITFDDGYRDNVEVAAPLLERLGLPATFFLAPELLSGAYPWWEELGWAFARTRRQAVDWGDLRLPLAGSGERTASYGRVSQNLKAVDEAARRRLVAELVELLQPEGPPRPPSPIMGWDEARSLRAHGFTIGSHSSRHSILANETPDDQVADLISARRQLGERLSVEIDLLAYPNGGPGDFDRTTVEAATVAGHRASVTTVDGWNDASTPPHELRRFVMYPEWGMKGFGVLPRHVARQLRRTQPIASS